MTVHCAPPGDIGHLYKPLTKSAGRQQFVSTKPRRNESPTMPPFLSIPLCRTHYSHHTTGVRS
jgi:hypothetical protein